MDDDKKNGSAVPLPVALLTAALTALIGAGGIWLQNVYADNRAQDNRMTEYQRYVADTFAKATEVRMMETRLITQLTRIEDKVDSLVMRQIERDRDGPINYTPNYGYSPNSDPNSSNDY